MNKPVAEQVIKDMVRDYCEGGLTMRQIGKMRRISPEWVRQLLYRYPGFAPRQTGRPRKQETVC